MTADICALFIKHGSLYILRGFIDPQGSEREKSLNLLRSKRSKNCCGNQRCSLLRRMEGKWSFYEVNSLPELLTGRDNMAAAEREAGGAGGMMMVTGCSVGLCWYESHSLTLCVQILISCIIHVLWELCGSVSSMLTAAWGLVGVGFVSMLMISVLYRSSHALMILLPVYFDPGGVLLVFLHERCW